MPCPPTPLQIWLWVYVFAGTTVATRCHRSCSEAAHAGDPVIAIAALLLAAGWAAAQDAPFGQRLYQDKADCQFCHGVNGDGRGDPRSPGKAPRSPANAVTR